MRLGVLDVGSNTVHLLLLDVYPGSQPVPYASHKTDLRLVRYLDAAGNISPEGRDALTAFVTEARDFAAENDAEDLLAFATSAIREAGNGDAVLEHVQSHSGVNLIEISGDQEAAVTFSAVRRWFGWSAGRILDLDIGGGSFEMAIGDNGLPAAAVSVPLGAARLTRRLIHGEAALPSETKRLRQHVAKVLAPAVETIGAVGVPTLTAGTSKSFRSLARICGAAPKGEGPYVPRPMHLEDLRLWTRRMEAMTATERAELPGVSVNRAAQMLAAGIVAESAMSMLGVETVQICPWALREGVILRRLDRLHVDPDVVLNRPSEITGKAV
ncbi:Ppx/GppA phosphatase family protein [Kocuria sp.]|uniref:Ppx/GppA phosphatase family protein n=1 Tax=Kocuria sp. TaxID=1871328 RepID=UPI0026DEC1F3|nr:Ppx/GppA family phosphatase [Kocuria sp.]MDO5618554.1 Ppx/GppA family phosphatase [Kocuria sp.]